MTTQTSAFLESAVAQVITRNIVGTASDELLVDILNTLDDSAEAFIVTNNFYSPNFGKPRIVIAPRRARDAWRQVLVLRT